MENKDKKHISEIALGEFAAAFAFVVFSMVFSSASAQTSSPIPTLPVDGHTTLQVARPDSSLWNDANYSLSDHLSWNPISNAQAVYNYASWNIAGTYSDTDPKTGLDRTFTKLPNDGLQVTLNNYPFANPDAVPNAMPSDNNDMIAGQKVFTNDGSGKVSTTDLYGGEKFENTYYQDGSVKSALTPADGDKFSKLTNPDGSSQWATIDKETGFDKFENYNPEGSKTAEYYLSPQTTLPDGSTGKMMFQPTTEGATIGDRAWTVAPVKTDSSGNVQYAEGEPVKLAGAMQAAKDENGQWALEKQSPELPITKIQPDSNTQFSGTKADPNSFNGGGNNYPVSESSGSTNPDLKPPEQFQPGDSVGDRTQAGYSATITDGVRNESVLDGDNRSLNISTSNSGAQADFNKWVADQSNKDANNNKENTPPVVNNYQPPVQDNTPQTDAQIAAENNKKAEEANQAIAKENNYQPPVQDNTTQNNPQETTDTSNKENTPPVVNNYQPPVQDNNPQNNTNYDTNAATMNNFNTVQFDNPPAEISTPNYDSGVDYGGYDTGGGYDSTDSGDNSGW